MISIISPWSGSTSDLLPDYAHACQHADEIVTINNACDHTTSTMLAQFHEQGGTLLTNASNLGFAAANNQGYARATGDIVIFLNSDVAADPRWLQSVLADVRDGALYGPSLSHQLVAGRWLPYIEGWCIAATRHTWDRLLQRYDLPDEPGYQAKYALDGPWDADAYPSPYWEDNDLCLRALQAGLSLVQTAWPIQHKGGRTAGPIAKHGRSFAQNERTFTDRVLQALEAEIAPTPTWEAYQRHVHTPSDIQHHLPLLYSLARGNVVELGTRSGVSTAALLAGVEAHGGRVWSVDVEDCRTLYANHPHWTFLRCDSREATRIMSHATVEYVDLLFIDTIHTWEHVAAELAAWEDYVRPGGTIAIHDPETFPGVRRAAREFAAARDWPMTVVLPCNGMAIIEVPA